MKERYHEGDPPDLSGLDDRVKFQEAALTVASWVNAIPDEVYEALRLVLYYKK